MLKHLTLKMNCLFSKQIYFLNNDAMKPKYIIDEHLVQAHTNSFLEEFYGFVY